MFYKSTMALEFLWAFLSDTNRKGIWSQNNISVLRELNNEKLLKHKTATENQYLKQHHGIKFVDPLSVWKVKHKHQEKYCSIFSLKTEFVKLLISPNLYNPESFYTTPINSCHYSASSFLVESGFPAWDVPKQEGFLTPMTPMEFLKLC